MLYNLRQSIHRKWFNYWCKDILSTPPIGNSTGTVPERSEGTVPTKPNLVILSMISHLDVMLYLIAIKTLYKFLKRGSIVVLNDGTLTDKDINLLKDHIKPVEVVNIKDIQTGRCPKGACWERLLLISDYVANNYILQLDSDSLVITEIPEVLTLINQNSSFALGSGFKVNGELLGQTISPMKKICEKMQSLNSEYIEIVADKNMCKLPGSEQMKYSRCSACFSGFAKDSFSRQKVEDFSQKMEGILGKRWHEWGTEKITSNVMICNSPAAEILPYPKYISYYANPKINYLESAYLHFTGTHRFKNGFYIKTAKKQINAILNGKG